MTELEYKEREGRSKKLLLWFAIVSMVMVFAGLTSGYIISKSRPDWNPFEMPAAFSISTIVMIISSVTFYLANKAIKKDNQHLTTIYLLLTLALGITFIYYQFEGFNDLISQKLYLTGPTSNITTQFLYVFVMIHIAHLAGGLISLLIVIYNHFKQKYNSSQSLGIELSAMFWHFLDFLWLYLFLFLYFFK